MSRSVAAVALLFLSCSGELDVCKSITSNKERFEEGVVIARFRSSVKSEDEATRVIEEESLHVASFVSEGSLVSARVEVPSGEECESMERLRENSSIETAGLALRPRSE